MVAVDWSKLPTELLNLISQRIYEEVDLIHFRSVCSTWRSSSVPKHHHKFRFQFPLLKFPFNPDFINRNKSFCYITKQNIFLIKPPQQEQTQTIRPSLIRICQNARGKSKLYHPLLQNGDKIPYTFVLDFNKLPILHLGSNFFMIDFDFTFDDKLYNPCDYMYPRKVVVVTYHGKKPLIVGTLTSPPQPLLMKCGDEKWKVIPDMSTKFGDICLFKGRPYAVDKIGKTVVVRPDSSVQLVAEPLVGGGDMKFLVESEGDLLLADVYECLCTDHCNPDHNDRVRIDLFKLNEKEKKWVKLTSLGDRVLFLGLGLVCSFSACASDLCVAKGNSVIFNNYIFESHRRFEYKCKEYVLDLDQGRLSLLSDCPEYSNLFWPPPKWIQPRYQGLDWGRHEKCASMAVVDWSILPTELLNLISQQIYEEVDLIHFRSVCSTWRSSSVRNHLHILPFEFPLLRLPFFPNPNNRDTINGNDPPFCHLSKQNIYLIKPPTQQQEQTLLCPWLIRVSQNICGQTQFFHPLLNYTPLSCNSLVLDFNKLSVLPLGSNIFIWDYDIKLEIIAHHCFYMFPEKVVAVRAMEKTLSLLPHYVLPHLCYFRNVEMRIGR